MYKTFFKRFLDLSMSLSGLLFLSPLFLLVAVWLHFANKGAGVFFFQERPGKGERLFRLVKFKTMTDERGSDGQLLPDAQRLTKTGKFIRAASLDELPQLWNVLRGDMSLIGPRPLLPSYLPWYTERERLRHSVRPGITGWAQVHGRSHTSWDDKLEYDAWYAEHVSLLLDLRIIGRTIGYVFSGRDVTVPTGDTLDKARCHKEDCT